LTVQIAWFLVCAGAWAGGSPEGPEFQVNESTASGSKYPRERTSVARGADGSFVVVWSAYTATPLARQEVVARRFGSDGMPLGTEFVVNTYSTGTQRGPAVGVAPDGSFVVVWEDNSFQDGTVLSVRARRVNSAGTPLGTEFLVPSYTSGSQSEPDIAVASDGTFVVVWHTYLPGEIYGGIGARRFASDGTPLTTEFKVETYTTESQFAPSIAMDAAGNFVVVWGSGGFYPGPDGSKAGIAARLFDADATPRGSEFVVNQITQNEQTWPSVDMDANGGFVVVWQNQVNENDYGATVVGRRFDADGNPLAAQFAIDAGAGIKQSHADVAIDAGARFVVSWQTYDYSGSYSGGGAARCFDSNGSVDGGVLIPAVTSYDAQESFSVATDSVGNFVLVWGDVPPGVGRQVFARLYTRPAVATTTTTTSTTSTTTSTTSSTLPSGQGCGDPIVDATVSAGGLAFAITPSDALFILQASVGLRTCELCVCDVTGDGNVSATDALVVLRAAVDLPVSLMCPACT